MMKKIIYATIALFASVSYLSGQKVWSEPTGQAIDPDKSIKLFVDISQTDCQKLYDKHSAAPQNAELYLWTWNPSVSSNGPIVGNGSWNGSNTALKMTHDPAKGQYVYSFEITPSITAFYGVTAEDVYKRGISFLVKELDGGGGGDCSPAGNEFKTEDLAIAVPSPCNKPRKMYTIPEAPIRVINGLQERDTMYASLDDVFTFYYDNKLETEASLQNLSSSTDLYVHIRAELADGTGYNVSTFSNLSAHPELKMSSVGDGVFRNQITLRPLLTPVVPAGAQIARVKYKIARVPVLSGADDLVDEDYFFIFID